MDDHRFFTPDRFLLFRHGLATHSTTGYGDQILTAQLLPEGIPPIERLARHIKDIPTQLHYASPVLRCKQTVEIVTRETGKEFTFDQRLGEYLVEAQMETFAQFLDRTTAALTNIIADAEKARTTTQSPFTIVICSHGTVIACLRHLMLDGQFNQDQILDFPQTGQLLELHAGQQTVTDFNSI